MAPTQSSKNLWKVFSSKFSKSARRALQDVLCSAVQGWARDGTGRDSPAKICPGSAENQINASNEFRDSGTERYLRHIETPDSETDRDSCSEMSGFVVPRDFSSGTVPQYSKVMLSKYYFMI